MWKVMGFTQGGDGVPVNSVVECHKYICSIAIVNAGLLHAMEYFF